MSAHSASCQGECCGSALAYGAISSKCVVRVASAPRAANSHPLRAPCSLTDRGLPDPRLRATRSINSLPEPQRRSYLLQMAFCCSTCLLTEPDGAKSILTIPEAEACQQQSPCQVALHSGHSTRSRPTHLDQARGPTDRRQGRRPDEGVRAQVDPSFGSGGICASTPRPMLPISRPQDLLQLPKSTPSQSPPRADKSAVTLSRPRSSPTRPEISALVHTSTQRLGLRLQQTLDRSSKRSET